MRQLTPVLEIEGVLALLRSEVDRAGGVIAWCKKTRVNRFVVTKALNGAKPLTESILKALNLRTAFAANEEIRPLTARSLFAVQDIVALLRWEVERAGGISEWSRKTGVHHTIISKALNKGRPPTKSIFRALKLRRVFVADDK